MPDEPIEPDLQACVLCEDVRQELNGLQTLVGVVSVVLAPVVPLRFVKLCLWTRWCTGAGRFRQASKIIGTDENQLVAESTIEFELREMESHATNIHCFGGVQFQSFGTHHVEIYLENQLKLRFPLPVLKVQPQQST